MSDFVGRIAARAAGHPVPGPPGVRLRRRSRFEPQPTAPQAVPYPSSAPAEPPATRAEGPAPGARPSAQPAPPVGAPSGRAPAPEQPTAVPSPQPPNRAPVVLPDPLDVVREHVVPMLMDAGELTPAESVEVVDADGADTTVPAGGVALRVDCPAYPQAPTAPDHLGGEISPAATDLHIHIDRIEVLRPAPADPRPASPLPPRADHAAYLARRVDRR